MTKAARTSGSKSGAAETAALSGGVQKVVDDVKQFGRMPQRNKGTSEAKRAENRLAKRFWEHRDSIPTDVLQELRALGGAAQPAVRPDTEAK